MSINALSSSAPLSKPNRYKFNDIEFNGSLALNTYDALYRNYDPTIGRWLEVDPEAEMFFDSNPYNFGFNDPGFWSDPFGNCPECDDKVTDPTKGEYYVSSGDALYMYNGTAWERQDGQVEGVEVTATSADEAQEESQQAQSRLGDWLASDLNNYAWAYKKYNQPHQREFLQNLFIQGRGRAFRDHPVTQTAFTLATAPVPIGNIFKYGGKALRFAKGLKFSKGGVSLGHVKRGQSLVGVHNIKTGESFLYKGWANNTPPAGFLPRNGSHYRFADHLVSNGRAGSLNDLVGFTARKRLFNSVKVVSYNSRSLNRNIHGVANYAQQFSGGIKQGIRNRYNVTFVW